jgi:hypothetical protein
MPADCDTFNLSGYHIGLAKFGLSAGGYNLTQFPEDQKTVLSLILWVLMISPT